MLRHKRTSSGDTRYIDVVLDYYQTIHQARARQSRDLDRLIGRYLCTRSG
jgi:hypothetical protein